MSTTTYIVLPDPHTSVEHQIRVLKKPELIKKSQNRSEGMIFSNTILEQYVLIEDTFVKQFLCF